MKFEEEGPITKNINGVEIMFDVVELCRILNILNEGFCFYESKKWPKVEGFKLVEVVHMLCGCEKVGRPTSHSLTVLSWVLQHTISHIFIPQMRTLRGCFFLGGLLGLQHFDRKED